MTLTELKYIVSVGQQKHFGRAAKNCPVSQPTLSLGIKKLAQNNLLLLGSGHCFRDQILQACPDCHTAGNLQGREGGSLETIRHMVLTDAGITVLPSSANMQSSQNPLLSMIPFQSLALSRTVALVWRKSFTRLEAIAALRNEILQCRLPGVSTLKNAPVAYS
jgi:LysR family hydrogen peroxide-inducible transcriptional activator